MAKNKSEEKIETSQEILQRLTGQINKHYDSPVIVDASQIELQKVPTDIFAFDVETGGGVPRGRGVILAGNESSFKSTFLYIIGGKFQRVCGNCMKGRVKEVNFKSTVVLGKDISPDNKNTKKVSIKVKDLSTGREVVKNQIVSLKYFANKSKANRYCPGEKISHKGKLKLYEYNLECSECTKPEYSIFFLADSEHNYTPAWARKFGVINYYVIVSLPEYSEQVGDIVREAMSTGKVSLIGVDSLDAQGPKIEDESSVEDQQMGIQARVWNKISRIIHSKMNKPFTYIYKNKEGKNVVEVRRPEFTIPIIQQYREKIGAYGDPRTLGGGKGKNFLSSLTVDFSRGALEWITENEKKSFVNVVQFNFNLVKHKTGLPYRIGSFYFDLRTFKINNELSILDYGVKKKIIIKTGSWFKYGKITKQGATKFMQYMIDNPKIMNEIKNKVLAKIKK